MLSLTFGVEIEFILALERLSSTSKHEESDIEPNVLRQAIAHDVSQDLDEWERLPKIFERAGLTLRGPSQDTIDYNEWKIVQDSSVNIQGLDLTDALPDRIKSINDASSWDAHPMELVSRVLPAPDSSLHPSLVELKEFLSTLRGPPSPDTPYGAYVTPSCGLHVHIGTSSGTLPFAVLRHLAYLTAIYEPVISIFHNNSRRYNNYCLSNLGAFCRSLHRCSLRRSLKSPREIRESIFAPELTPVDLGVLMSEEPAGTDLAWRSSTLTAGENAHQTVEKYRIVNWNGITTANTGKPTLEFRQHAGCVDANGIAMWVRFLTRLVRTAERLAAESDTDANTGAKNTKADDISPGNRWPDLSTPNAIHEAAAHLFRLLGLDLEERRYWHTCITQNLEDDEFIIPEPTTDTCNGCSMDLNARSRRRDRSEINGRLRSSNWSWVWDGRMDDTPVLRWHVVGKTKKGRDRKKARKEQERKNRAKLRAFSREIEKGGRSQGGWASEPTPKMNEMEPKPVPGLIWDDTVATISTWEGKSASEADPETVSMRRLHTESWAMCQHEPEWPSEVRW